MISKPTKFIIGGMLIVALAVIYLFKDLRSDNPLVFKSNTPPHAVSGEPDPGVSGDPKTPASDFPMPDLNRPIVIKAQLSTTDAQKAKEYINASQAELKKDPDLYDEWMNLALYRKLIGDYEAAREIWEYVTKIRPSSGMALHNLGSLHFYELKRPDEAESYYLQAIKAEPSNLQFYIAASEYYRYFKKNIPKAKEILTKGTFANPGQASVLAELRDSF